MFTSLDVNQLYATKQFVYTAPKYMRIRKIRPNHQIPVEPRNLRGFGNRGVWNNERFWWWKLRDSKENTRRRLPNRISR